MNQSNIKKTEMQTTTKKKCKYLLAARFKVDKTHLHVVHDLEEGKGHTTSNDHLINFV